MAEVLDGGGDSGQGIEAENDHHHPSGEGGGLFTLGTDNTPEMYSELEFSLRHQAMPMAMQQAIQSEMYSLREEKEVGQNVFVAAPSISPPRPGAGRAQ